jgi:hypothetical protein
LLARVIDHVAGTAATVCLLAVPHGNHHIAIVQRADAALEEGVLACFFDRLVLFGGRFDVRPDGLGDEALGHRPLGGAKILAKLLQRER